MICEISTSDLPSALANGASLIIISADGSSALVRVNATIDCIESYTDDQLSNLMNESKWRQPCRDCKI